MMSDDKQDDWREKQHVYYTNGQTCNCDECVQRRGFILCTRPFKDEYIDVVFHVRESEL